MKDLTGMTFHELTVKQYAGKLFQGSRSWKCECSCGKICYVRGTRLTSGNTKSCGHLKKISEKKSKRRRNFENQQIGDFIVDFYSHNDDKTHCAVWMCHCAKCGETRYIKAYQLAQNYNTKCSKSKKETDHVIDN